MRCWWSFSIVLIGVGALWGCSGSGEVLPEDVLARVNEAEILAAAFHEEWRGMISQPLEDLEANDLERLKRAYLDQVIERKLLVQEARRLKIQITEEERIQAFQEITLDYPGNGFREKLALRGMTLEAWMAWLEEKLLAEKLIQVAQSRPLTITEEETRQFYEANRDLFRQKERVRARQIVVADAEEARQLLKRLKKGERFDKLARERSLGPEKIHGGDLGYFSRGERPPEFDCLFSMEKGALSEVIKSPYGYHIFRLEDKRPARTVPFEEARPQITQQLSQKKVELQYQEWLSSLKEKAHIRINEKRLRKGFGSERDRMTR